MPPLNYYLCLAPSEFSGSMISFSAGSTKVYFTNISPSGGAVGPAARRSQASRIEGMLPSSLASLPISINVPAMIRTILYRKPCPEMRMMISRAFAASPSFPGAPSPTVLSITSAPVMVRTVVAAWEYMLQKLLKSWVPIRLFAALSIFPTSKGV